MLGGLLTRQAEEEEEERQSRLTLASVGTTPGAGEIMKHNSEVPPHEGGFVIVPPTNEVPHAQHAGGLILTSIPNNNNEVSPVEDEEDYSSLDDDDNCDDTSSVASHRGCSNERSSLLGSRNNKRRKKRDTENNNNIQSILQTAWNKVYHFIVAVADVDNVWDSPDADGQYNTNEDNRRRRRRRGIIDDYDVMAKSNNSISRLANYAAATTTTTNNTNTDTSTSSTTQQQQQQSLSNITNNPASRIIYNIISWGISNNNSANSTRNSTAAIFWFVILFVSYAIERCTFKLLVDRVAPFRLLYANLILFIHVLLIGLGLTVSKMFRWLLSSASLRGRRKRRPYDNNINRLNSNNNNDIEMMPTAALPLVDIGLMAILDTLYLLLGVISGAHVPPVLTVILIQTTIPLTACFTQFFHPDGRCNCQNRLLSTNNDGVVSPPPTENYDPLDLTIRTNYLSVQHTITSCLSSQHSDPNNPNSAPVKGWGGLSRYHITGMCLMFLAIFIGLIPAVLSLHHVVITVLDAMPDRTAFNTIVFCFTAIPATMSQLYKEHTLTRLRQPIDRDSLNMVLSLFQLIVALCISPVVYCLQGMGTGMGWEGLYPSKEMSTNFHNGLRCALGSLDSNTMAHGYEEEAECQYSSGLIVLHVLSIIMVGVAIDKLAMTTKVMYRGVSMGIIFAVIFMFWVQRQNEWVQYGPLVNCLHILSTIVLILGAEIYHRVSLVDASFETVYPEVENFYEDDEN